MVKITTLGLEELEPRVAPARADIAVLMINLHAKGFGMFDPPAHAYAYGKQSDPELAISTETPSPMSGG